ncbi:MAG TPA: Vms1/Ankzf1 family peptidyl-tRNA hydrolase [Vicinamibacterales bacterium]|jgi:peptide chain release factor subunit 1|nr:Vms1/Ankzf1 family peptidyl-tRNA hydrolase [Vicinamibacterales bacterium]
MTLNVQLEKLAAFGPVPYPVVSLYLNAQPGPTGRDQYQTFIRKEFAARSRTYPSASPDRESLDRDLERITRYLDMELQPSANGVAIFACSAGELFESVQLGAPIEHNWLYIGDAPHLYPLARLESQYPRYAAVVADTNSARIIVVATGEVVAEQEIKGVKTKRNSQGGWSQARFQRHIENFHLQHAKEVVDALEQIVQREGIQQIILAGDEVIIPLLREQMSKQLAEKIVDHVRLDTSAPLDDVLKTTLGAMKRLNERTDKEKVETAVGAFRAGGLGVVGPESTFDALIKGQVDELLVSANVRGMHGSSASRVLAAANDAGLLTEPAVDTTSAGEAAENDPQVIRLIDELITKATQTGAVITFIEDASLLSRYGGVAALLRFRI